MYAFEKREENNVFVVNTMLLLFVFFTVYVATADLVLSCAGIPVIAKAAKDDSEGLCGLPPAGKI